MKKVLFFLSVILVGLSSCEGPRGPQGLQGIPGRDGEDGIISNRAVLDYKISSASWQRLVDSSGNFLQYQFVFDEKELTDYVYDNAAIVGYVEVWEGNYSLQKSMPLVTIHEDRNGMWTRTVDFDYGIESIAFNVKTSDFNETRPGDYNFRIVFLW